MSGKNQSPITLGPSSTRNEPGLSWQSASPAIGFLPLNNNTVGQGSVPSGVRNGTMSGTNTIYTQIIDVSRIDNMGLEVTWTGNPVGTITVNVSNSGISFYDLTFDPALAQPSGSAGGYAINLNQLPFKYVMLKYVNTSGSGVLTVYGQIKDLN